MIAPGCKANARMPSASPRFHAEGEQHVRRLRLTIGDPGVIGAVLEVRVVEVDAGEAVAARRHRNDACAASTPEGRPKPCGQLEVTKVVGRELHFVAARVAGQRHRHHASAVDQDVQWLATGEEVLGEGVDGGRVGEVHRLDLDIDALEGLARLGQVAGRDDHACPGGA
jgi:hypothetical protein